MALNCLANLHFCDAKALGQHPVGLSVKGFPNGAVGGWDAGAAEFGAQFLSGFVADDVVKGCFVGRHGFVLCVVDGRRLVGNGVEYVAGFCNLSTGDCMFPQYFHERLRSERERMGLTQDEMVLKTGVAKRSYCAYEGGETAPSAKLLTALVVVGLDVAYLLTGQRSVPVAPQALLPEGDRILLDNFHAAPAGVQAGVKTTLGAFAPAAAGRSGGRRKAG